MTKELKLSAELENLNSFTDFVSKELFAPKSVISKVLIACDEILSNIVNYSQSEYMALKLENNNSFVTLSFSDNGKAFNPLETESPDIEKEASEREVGGLGIFLVKSLMDDVSYKRTETENILTIRKNF